MYYLDRLKILQHSSHRIRKLAIKLFYQAPYLILSTYPH